MSGGVAYVLDEDGGFTNRCNKAMVELSPIDDQDESTVRGLVEAHVKRTASEKGKRLLDEWEEARLRFVKVMPLEYKKVLEAKKPAALRAEAQKGVA
jgi:glutamate synthase domain-containing protein 3